MHELCKEYIMGRIKNPETIEVCQGVYLKHQGSSKNYHYHFTLNGIPFRQSTKTTNVTDAKRIALIAYEDTKQRAFQNKSVERVTFKKAAAQHLKNIQGQPRHKFHKETLTRHFTPYFNRFDDIKDITRLDLDKYIAHRKEKVNGNVTHCSLNKESAVFNQIMQCALAYEWLDKELKIHSLKEAKNRRDDFTEKEYEHLLKISRKRRDAYLPSKHKGKSKGLVIINYWNLALLHDIIIVLANTGLRVNEIKNVKWRHVNFKKATISVENSGKTGKSRVAYLRGDYGLRALERIKERRIAYLSTHTNEPLNENEYIQCIPNGIYRNSLAKAFRELIKECNFTGRDTATFALTSLRHTYATLRLTDKKHRASVHALTKQMGTSTRMMEEHYNHCITESFAEELRGKPI